MTLQASGPISFSQIANEFGTPPGKNLGAYRLDLSIGTLTNLRLDTGVPGPGQPIGFSSFYNKKLNVVVDLFSIPNNSQRLIARARYPGNTIPVVPPGTSKSNPAVTSGTRVIINVNKIIGSDNSKTNINQVAVRTGTWDTGTQLEMEIGPNAEIYGAGGNGGNGGSSQQAGFPGGFGTSALGIDFPTTVVNKGYIQAGGGGGGGGSWINRTTRTGFITRNRRERRSAGNGGGGGAGFPLGTGGAGGIAGANNGNPGIGGTFRTGGAGGTNGGAGGAGGTGGSGGRSGTAGAAGDAAGGAAGAGGRAIIIYNNGSGTTITNVGVGTVIGTTIFNTPPQ